jgi:amino acid transporter
MENVVVFIVAFLFVALAVLMLFGKIDFMLAKYKLAFREGRLKHVKIREYDKKARPVIAVLFFLVALLLVLSFLYPSVADKLAIVVLAVVVPFTLVLEFKFRKK